MIQNHTKPYNTITMNYNSIKYETEEIDRIFGRRLNDLEMIPKDNNGMPTYHQDDYIFIHYENRSKTKKIDYIGKVVKTKTHKTTSTMFDMIIVTKKDIIEILWEREGQTYRAPRLSKKQSQWERHTDEKYLFTNTMYSDSINFIVLPTQQIRLYRVKTTTGRLQIMTMKEYEETKDSNIYQSIGDRGCSLEYYKIPKIADYIQTVSLVKNIISPIQFRESMKEVFDKFPYDIYRTIVSYM